MSTRRPGRGAPARDAAAQAGAQAGATGARAGVVAIAALSLGCRDPGTAEQPAPGEARPAAAPSLESEVARLLAAPDLPAALHGLKLPPDGFDAMLVPPYRSLFSSYAAKFNDEAAALAVELRRLTASSPAPAIKVRRHYAGDPALPLAQGRVRWAQPVQSESWVVALGEAQLDAVWVSHRGRWYLLLGLDEAALSALAAIDPSCARAARLAGAPGPCSDAAWMAIDGALRDDADRVTRACDRAAHLCIAAPSAPSSR